MSRILLLLPLGACIGSDKPTLNPCGGDIEVGIFDPVDFSIFPEGAAIELSLMINDTCGSDLQENSSFVLSSSLQEEVVIDYTFVSEDEVNVELKEPLNVGQHLLNLKVSNSDSNPGEDQVNLSIVENTPPTIQLRSPSSLGEGFLASEGALLIVDVNDLEEDLDTLDLKWLIDGDVYPGPENPTSNGYAEYSPTNLDPGCYSLEVVVADVLGQTASATGDFVLYVAEEDLDAYIYLEDLDGDGWGSEANDIISCVPPETGVPFTAAIDCDDTNPEIYPTRPDYCGDGIDSDCEPSTPFGCFPTGSLGANSADVTLAEIDNLGATTRYGLDIVGAGDFNNDGFDDLAYGTSDVFSGGPNAPIYPFGSVQLIYGPIVGSTPDVDAHESRSEFQCCGNYLRQSREFGRMLAGGSDITGDGIDDLFVGAMDARYGAQDIGAAVLISGYDSAQYTPPETILDLSTASQDSTYIPSQTGGMGVWTIQGEEVDSDAAREIYTVKDMSGDGLDELVVTYPVNNSIHIIQSQDIPTDSYFSDLTDLSYWTVESDYDI
ncbi:MAG: putative metal-binding motif-containing protein, partial [Myxococcota bacterium]|nr:putative metal-binding motif-containing protein [Myxococcota bacterium]